MSNKLFTYLLLCILQEENPFVPYDVPAQNLLRFNRFLLNPTFSTVREDKSYFNLFHRNQSVSFDDNNQTYFLSYSGRINDRTGLGLSLYTQTEGTITNFGVLANYAYGVKLSDKSNFTFGANVSYYNSGFDSNRANPVDSDPLLNSFQNSALLSFQPGFNISYGPFDFGVFAENLFDYNLRTSESITDFSEKTYSAHLQYTHAFENGAGILENGRLLPLARVRSVGQDDLVLGGSLILDLPKIGWLQAGYDNFFGASAGIGFNLNQRLSLGYTMERGVSNNFDNFGVTHEISFAYSLTPNLTEDRVLLEDDLDETVVQDAIEEEDALAENDNEEVKRLKEKIAENDAIIAELMFRQDSLESNRQKDLEKRFDMIMRMVRRETNGERPDLEERVKKTYFVNNDKGLSSTYKPIEPTLEVVQSKLDPTAKTNTLASNKITNDTLENLAFIPTSIKKKSSVKPLTEPKVSKKPITKVTKDIIPNTPSLAKVAKRNNVKSKVFKDLQGVSEGYYVVVNVYKGDRYMKKFIADLQEKGVEADYFINPKNGLRYVYLKRFDKWQTALAAYKSNIDGTYQEDKWIMNVDNSALYTDKAYVNNTKKLREKASKYDTSVLQKNVVKQDKLAAKAPTTKGYNISGVPNGYYIIANVFANPKNANRFVKLLNNQGLSASYFINPKNNYRYVYLKKHQSWNNALQSYYTKLNDAYTDEMWIMRITPNQLA